MSATPQPPRTPPTAGRAGRARRRPRGASRQPTKAELQAIEARRRATTVLSEDAIVVDEPPTPQPRRETVSRRVERQRTPTRPILSKDQEYSYIRSDLRRLFVTAGPLLLFMIGLLFVLNP